MKLAALTLALAFMLVGFSQTAFAVGGTGISYDGHKGVIIVGDGLAACNGAKTGAIRYNSGTPNIEFCDGSVWRMLAASSIACGSPTGLSFTNVTGQPTSTIVGSNTATITFSGCAGSSLLASVTGAPTAQISINGGGWTTSGSIQSGQTLQVRMTTSASANTTLTATVTVNATSANWTTTTIAGSLKIFATSGGYIAGTMGGLAGADAICQSEAGSLGYAGTYKALMSDDTTSASSRLTLTYPIVRASDGVTVSASNLWSGTLSNPVVTSGNPQIWSATSPAGASLTGYSCSNWSSTSGSTNIGYGCGAYTDIHFLENNACGNCGCSAPSCSSDALKVVCIQQDAASCTSIGGLSFSNLTSQPLSSSVQSGLATITFSGCSGGSSLTADVIGEPSAQISINGGAWTTSGAIASGQTLRVRMTTSGSVNTTKTATVEVGATSTNWTTTTVAGASKVFLTSGLYNGGTIGGLAGADALCQSEAGTAGYAGTYKAIMSDATTSAASRLTLTYPIVRATDGATVAAVNLWNGTFSNPISTTGSIFAWTGTNNDGSISTGNTCSSWSSTGASGTSGYANAASNPGGCWGAIFNATCTNNNCATGNHIYCIQQ